MLAALGKTSCASRRAASVQRRTPRHLSVPDPDRTRALDGLAAPANEPSQGERTRSLLRIEIAAAADP